MRIHLKMYCATPAPKIPVSITTTAVNVGMPPIFSLMPMAIGVVTVFGPIDGIVNGEAPNSYAIPIALTIAVAPPINEPANSASQLRFNLPSC